jgi:hydroxyacylglutathione hydrolase
VVIDTRPWSAFKAGHIPGALYAPLDKTFPTVAGSFVGENEDIVLVIDEARVEEAVRNLVRIGLDRVTGFVAPKALERPGAAPRQRETSADIGPAEAREKLSAPVALVLDVRNTSEFNEGHIPGATSAPYTRLASRLADLPRDRTIIVNCRSGARSSRAVAFLQRAGFDATNLAGGFLAWEKQAPAGVER